MRPVAGRQQRKSNGSNFAPVGPEKVFSVRRRNSAAKDMLGSPREFLFVPSVLNCQTIARRTAVFLMQINRLRLLGAKSN